MRAILLLCTLMLSSMSNATSVLTENQLIDSSSLGYSLQYRVYLPSGYDTSSRYPTIYLVDGQWFLSSGEITSVLDNEILANNIEPVIAVFVDSRNPNNLKENRRNKEFMCNENYLRFFVNELMPQVSSLYATSEKREDRIIGGLSFGGLNAACFGVMASNVFGGVGMLSPASDEHLNLVAGIYKKSNEAKLSIFLSGGKRNDNLRAIRKFHKVLLKKEHNINYFEVPFGHDWKNWQPLLDDLLQTFFVTRE